MRRVTLVIALFATLPILTPVLAQTPPPPPVARVVIFNAQLKDRGWFQRKYTPTIYLDGQPIATMRDNSVIWFDIPNGGRHLMQSDLGKGTLEVLDLKPGPPLVFFRAAEPRFIPIPFQDPKDYPGLATEAEKYFMKVFSKPGDVDIYANPLKIVAVANTLVAPPPAPAAPPPAPEKFGNDEVISLVRAGQNDTIIINKIRSTPSAKFDVTNDGLNKLKAGNVNDFIIKEMQDIAAAAGAAKK